METLLVLKFDSQTGAGEMRDRLLSLQKRQLITIEDAAIMSKDANGRPELEHLHTLRGALGGAFWGMLFGLLFVPQLSLTVGPATPEIAGGMSKVGIDDKFIKNVGESITPGKSALFFLVSVAVIDMILEQTEDLEYDVL
jgi:uncharacterized membrane protein